MITFSYILSQILAISTHLLSATTYYMKNKKSILITGIISIFMHATSYALLWAWTGVAMGIIAILRNMIFIFEDKKEKKNKAILYAIFSITILSTIFTYDSIFSLFPMFATLIYTYSIWQKNIRKYRLIGIITSTCFIIYDLHVKSILDMVAQLVLLICSLNGYIIYKKDHVK